MPSLPDLIAESRPDELSAATQLLDDVRRSRIAYHPSPVDWRDEVLYFLLPDRFSDGQEDRRPQLTRQAIRDLRSVEPPGPGRPDWSWQQWAESGKRWQGGTLRGIQSKLAYLQDLGITPSGWASLPATCALG